MSYGGLRGAVGFSLVKLIDKSIVPSAGIFVTATLAVIMSTVFIQVKTANFKCQYSNFDALPGSLFIYAVCYVPSTVLIQYYSG